MGKEFILFQGYNVLFQALNGELSIMSFEEGAARSTRFLLSGTTPLPLCWVLPPLFSLLCSQQMPWASPWVGSTLDPYAGSCASWRLPVQPGKVFAKALNTLMRAYQLARASVYVSGCVCKTPFAQYSAQ